jgi:hypothetical protein
VGWVSGRQLEDLSVGLFCEEGAQGCNLSAQPGRLTAHAYAG